MIDDAQWVTYRELNERANRIAHGLSATGVKPGDYVCILLGNCVEYLLFFGCSPTPTSSTSARQ